MIYYTKVLKYLDDFNALRRINAEADYQLKALKKLNKAILELQAYQRGNKRLLERKLNETITKQQNTSII